VLTLGNDHEPYNSIIIIYYISVVLNSSHSRERVTEVRQYITILRVFNQVWIQRVYCSLLYLSWSEGEQASYRTE